MAGTEEADVFVRLRRVAPALSKAERRIAEAAIADPAVVVDSTITRLAEVCDTSPATVASRMRPPPHTASVTSSTGAMLDRVTTRRVPACSRAWPC